MAVDIRHQAGGHFQFAFHECSVNDELRGYIGNLLVSPLFDLPSQGLEVPLHAIDTDGDRVQQVERPGMLCQHGSEVAREGHIFAN